MIGLSVCWITTSFVSDKVFLILFGIPAIIFIFFDLMPIYLFVLLSYLFYHCLYQLLFYVSIADWIIMILMAVISFFVVIYFLKHIKMNKNKLIIYSAVYPVIMLEFFLLTNYFLVNPRGQSLIMAVLSYLFIGYIESEHSDEGDFKTYLLMAAISFFMIFVFSGQWSLG